MPWGCWRLISVLLFLFFIPTQCWMKSSSCKVAWLKGRVVCGSSPQTPEAVAPTTGGDPVSSDTRPHMRKVEGCEPLAGLIIPLMTRSLWCPLDGMSVTRGGKSISQTEGAGVCLPLRLYHSSSGGDRQLWKSFYYLLYLINDPIKTNFKSIFKFTGFSCYIWCFLIMITRIIFTLISDSLFYAARTLRCTEDSWLLLKTTTTGRAERDERCVELRRLGNGIEMLVIKGVD